MRYSVGGNFILVCENFMFVVGYWQIGFGWRQMYRVGFAPLE